MCMLNGKMDFASHEDEVMDEEINDQHKEMSDQEMSDEDHVLSNDSCCRFGSDMENDDDTIEIIYQDLNRAQVNTLRPVKKICYIDGHGRYCSSCIVRIYDINFHIFMPFENIIPTYVLFSKIIPVWNAKIFFK